MSVGTLLARGVGAAHMRQTDPTDQYRCKALKEGAQKRGEGWSG